MIIIEQKCHVTYSSVISVCISNNLPADLNTSIHVTSGFFFLLERGRGGGGGIRNGSVEFSSFIALMAEACRAYLA